MTARRGVWLALPTLMLSSLLAASPAGAACPDYVPEDCTPVTGDNLPKIVKNHCYVIKSAGSGPIVENEINVLDGGAIYFVEDPGKTIDFQVSALLIEKGGIVQAGSPECPFGANDGKLTIGLYGEDPTDQGTKTPAGAGIQCLTNEKAPDPRHRCFPPGRDYKSTFFYCTEKGDDPCSSTKAPAVEPKNSQLEGYGTLNFDTNPFGYKTIGVAYGGTLSLFGYKGAKPIQTPSTSPDNWGKKYDSDQHCVAPTKDESTLDSNEMKAWANLSGSSWARLEGSVDKASLTVLTLDRSVSDWKVGDEIVIGATDWHPNHSEMRTLRACPNDTPKDGAHFCVDTLKYPHFGKIFDTKVEVDAKGGAFTNKVNRSAVDMRATVGLLTRSIQIYSLGDKPKRTEQDKGFPAVSECLADNSKPDCYFGGHLIIRQGFKEARIQGVEFKQLGQGGRMGHYPVHYHLAKSTKYTEKPTFVKDSSVWDSMTRFITIHGTHDITLARNVGYLSLGHGYYIEDASEIRNKLCHNLGVSARGALKQYVTAQAQPEHWCGGAPPPSARLVPPILDGVAANSATASGSASQHLGSDSYMPTMFWMMNAYNEFVGNAAVGVHGFGSCFWLLGSAVSGPSITHAFDGLAKYNNVAPQIQAPLLRFRGNTCMTAALALPSQAEIAPSTPFGGAKGATGFDAVENPYLVNGSDVAKNYARPIVNGNFQPIQPGAGTANCSSTNPNPVELARNAKACVTTVIDRFASSFNWAQVNFGSIWLRPWFYLFSNGALTDQLSGGLTFVTGGSWLQAPPAYLALAQNSLFVGTTQHGGSKYAKRTGPVLEVTSNDNPKSYAPCVGHNTCNSEADGTGWWKGDFNPKRLINIYDGPNYADGNTFLNVGSWECKPQACAASGTCSTELPCGIYGSTRQPAGSGDNMIVLDAAIGWKQPNGFFYPPAFAYRRSAFLSKIPTSGSSGKDVNQCFSAGPPGYDNPSPRDGSCRHNVIDRTRDYVEGNLENLTPEVLKRYPASQNTLPSTTIDFTTILIDLDASVTGASGVLEAPAPNPPIKTSSTSVSRNVFFDAPAQTPECLSYGVQTSPYAFVTTNMALLRNPPNTEDNRTENAIWPRTPMVALYRQWTLASDPPGNQDCGPVCSDKNFGKYGCARATFMGMSSVFQSPYLTMTEPPGLSPSQPGALYYIDTNSGAQTLDCFTAREGSMEPARFEGNDSYVVFNMFPRNDSRTRYQLYVGSAKTLDDIEGRFVRIGVHDDGGNTSKVRSPCDPTKEGWCKGMQATVENGVLTVTLDHAPLAKKGQFAIAAKVAPPACKDPPCDYDRCMPRDLCYFDSATKRCEFCAGSAKCIRQNEWLPEDVAAMNRPDANGKKPLETVCQDWASLASGDTKVVDDTISMAECPEGGCLGFAFKLPNGFQPKPYDTVNQEHKLTHCFLESAWAKDSLAPKANPPDPLCGDPREQKASDFCTDPMLMLAAENDAHIAKGLPEENFGAEAALLVGGGQDPVRSVIGFDGMAIDSYLAQRTLTKATLVLTTAAVEPGGSGDLIEAHPLRKPVVEGGEGGAGGNGGNEATNEDANSDVPAGSQTEPPGVTWACAIDQNPQNERVSDCAQKWNTRGGDFGAATSAPAAVGAVNGTLSWDVTADVMAGTAEWLLRKSDESNAPGVAFFSSEGALEERRARRAPMLILE